VRFLGRQDRRADAGRSCHHRVLYDAEREHLRARAAAAMHCAERVAIEGKPPTRRPGKAGDDVGSSQHERRCRPWASTSAIGPQHMCPLRAISSKPERASSHPASLLVLSTGARGPSHSRPIATPFRPDDHRPTSIVMRGRRGSFHLLGRIVSNASLHRRSCRQTEVSMSFVASATSDQQTTGKGARHGHDRRTEFVSLIALWSDPAELGVPSRGWTFAIAAGADGTSSRAT